MLWFKISTGHLQIWEWRGTLLHFQYFTTKKCKLLFFKNNVIHHFPHYHGSCYRIFSCSENSILGKRNIRTILGILFPFKTFTPGSKYIEKILSWQLLCTRCCSFIHNIKKPLKGERRIILILQLVFCRDIWKGQTVQRAHFAHKNGVIIFRTTSKSEQTSKHLYRIPAEC